MTSGIYKILNTVNGKFYIGSAVYLNSRLRTHKANLNNNKHPNKYIQAAWNFYRAENFEFSVLEVVDKENLLIREQHWIDFTNCFNRKIGYNLSPTAGNCSGIEVSIVTRLKLSNALKGIKRSNETRAKMSAWQVGRKMSDEAKLKISLANKGHTRNRNKEKWPHELGCKCKCDECFLKRKQIKIEWDNVNLRGFSCQ